MRAKQATQRALASHRESPEGDTIGAWGMVFAWSWEDLGDPRGGYRRGSGRISARIREDLGEDPGGSRRCDIREGTGAVVKKCIFFAFFYNIICICQIIVVPL